MVYIGDEKAGTRPTKKTQPQQGRKMDKLTPPPGPQRNTSSWLVVRNGQGEQSASGGHGAGQEINGENVWPMRRKRHCLGLIKHHLRVKVDRWNLREVREVRVLFRSLL